MIKTPFPYQGSKRKELPLIEKYQPEEFDKVIDAFGGGGSVSLFYEQTFEVNVIYNEIDKGIVDLFKTLQDEKKTQNLIQEVKALPINNETFREKQNDLDNPANFLYCVSVGFRGNPRSGVINMRKNNQGIYVVNKLIGLSEKLSIFPPIVKNITILNMNAIDLIKKYANDEYAFIYCDPPYMNKHGTNVYSRFEMKDLEELFKIFLDKKTKAKMMLHIDFSGWTYDKLKDHIVHYYPSNYNIGKNGITYHKSYQLIACNY
jgi:site-specific DNA-adenine methylase